jgi:hypothetical protein
MTKEAKLYCDACNAITSGQYLKDCFCKLIKYRKALTNPIPSGMDQSPVSYQILARLTDNLNTEIERRKEKFWSVAKPLLIGLVLVIIAFVLSFFFRPNNTYIIHQNNQPQPQQQVKSENEVAPSSNQNIEKQNQQTKKTN